MVTIITIQTKLEVYTNLSDMASTVPPITALHSGHSVLLEDIDFTLKSGNSVLKTFLDTVC
jgi:hypothetical protein